jgi:hypothetical protein
MRWLLKTYVVEVVRDLDPNALHELGEDHAKDAADSGYLAGNSMYSDLRGFGWTDVELAISFEQKVVDRLSQADDLEAAIADWDEERFLATEPAGDLWGLDVGVAAATIALSAQGAAPVGSCNAGGFGGLHQASYPYVAFFAPRRVAGEIMALAEIAQVGLVSGAEGLAVLFGKTDLDLMKFARLSLQQASGRSD